MSDTSTLQNPIDDDFDDDIEDFLPQANKRRFFRGRNVSLLLIAALVLVGVFSAGAYAQDRWGTSTSNANNRPPTNAQRNGASGGQAFGGSPQAGATTDGSASRTTGTVKVIEGKNDFYITSADGTVTKVLVDPNTSTIARSSNVKATDLKPGDTVVIQGEKGEDGALAATFITARSANR